jgi:hypothetical protein
MNVGGIGQHDAAQVARGRGGVDVAGEAALAEVREIAAVVDVRVGEHHDSRSSRDRRGTCCSAPWPLATSLIEAAIEQDALAVDLDEVF